MRPILILLCIFLLGLPLLLMGAEPAEQHQGRVIAQPMSHLGAPWLTRPTRATEEAPTVLLGHLNLHPGATACDVGVGNGYHAVPMARAVAPGHVYGVDIQQEMLDLLMARAADQAQHNIIPVLSTPTDPSLPADTCDVVLLVDAYHEFSDPVAMLAGIRRALKPDGALFVVEFRAEDPAVPIKPDHKMTKQQVIDEIGDRARGYKLIGQHDDLPTQHVLVFQRDDGPARRIRPRPWSLAR